MSSSQKKKTYSRPSERGLSPSGGAWNLAQASEWSGIGENYLRTMAKNKEIPCAYYIGRRTSFYRAKASRRGSIRAAGRAQLKAGVGAAPRWALAGPETRRRRNVP